MEHETWSMDRIQVCPKQTQPVDLRGFVLDLLLGRAQLFHLPLKHVHMMHKTPLTLVKDFLRSYPSENKAERSPRSSPSSH